MLDLTMRHEGEPPARLLASVSMRLKEKDLPAMFAPILAPFMSSAEDLDDSLAAELTATVEAMKLRGTPKTEAEAAVKAALADLVAAAAVEETDEPFQEKAKPTLFRRVMHHLRGEQVRIINRAPRYPGPMRADRQREALADAMLAVIDPRHRPTVGAPYAGMSYGEAVKLSLEAMGHRPRSIPDAIRMAGGMHTTSDFPGIAENALNKSLARQMEQIAPAIAHAAHEIAAGDYHGGKLLGLSASGMPQEVGEAGEIKHVTIDETGEFKPVPRTFAAKFTISHKVQVNDTAGA